MKRIWIGIGLLAVLLASSIWLANSMEKSHLPSAQYLDRAALLAREDQWEGARALLRQANDCWQKKKLVTASFTDHEPMDEIEGLFARLTVYANLEETDSFCSTCVYLARQLDSLGQCHSMKIWNLL